MTSLEMFLLLKKLEHWAVKWHNLEDYGMKYNFTQQLIKHGFIREDSIYCTLWDFYNGKQAKRIKFRNIFILNNLE